MKKSEPIRDWRPMNLACYRGSRDQATQATHAASIAPRLAPGIPEKASNMDLATRSVMVTGGAGFLGRFVCEGLRELGCEKIFVPRSSDYDLRSEAGVRDAFEHSKPDVVFHLAARVGGIGANMRNPGRYFFDNAMMGLQIIERCRVEQVEKVVVVGTICAYPKFTPIPFREDDLWNGFPEETNAPYGIAKKALLTQCDAYRRQYGLNAVYLLPVNMYGPGDNFDLEDSHVIPAMIRKFIEARNTRQPRITLWGDGSPTREFVHARDASRGILLAAEHIDESAPVNIGSGREISMKDLATIIQRLTGYVGETIWDASKPNGQPRRCLDTTKAREAFGFDATISLEDGLRETIAWYEAQTAVAKAA
jgi:GDP-L-fucose synthase